MKRRIMTFLVCLVLIAALLPSGVFAEDIVQIRSEASPETDSGISLIETVPHGNAVITADVQSDAPENVKYEWFICEYNEKTSETTETPIPDEDKAELTIEDVTEDLLVCCIAKDGEDGEPQRFDFEIVLKNDLKAEAVQHEVSAEYGDPVSISTTVSAEETDRLNYSWYKEEIAEDNLIEGADRSDYTLESATESGSYWCLVDDGYGSSAEVEFILSVDSCFRAWIAKTAVQENDPYSTEETVDVESGKDITLTALASSKELPENIVFEWDLSGMEGSSFSVEGTDGPLYDDAENRVSRCTLNKVTENKTVVCKVYDTNRNKVELTFNINVTAPPLISITEAVVSGIKNKTYTGSAIVQDLKVESGKTVLQEGKDYKVKYSNNKNAGKAKIIITGIGGYTGTRTETFTIGRASQTLTLNVTSVSPVVGRKKAIKVSGAKGTLSYKSTNTNYATVKKSSTGCIVTGVKVGSRTIIITAAASKDGNYKPATVKVRVHVVPAATSSLKAQTVSSGIRLSWKAVKGAKGYKIYNGAKLIKTITKGTTVTFVSKNTKTNGSAYTFKVIPYADTGSGMSRSVKWYYLSGPARPDAVSSTGKKATVSWKKNTKASGYVLQYSSDLSFPSGKTKAVRITGASNTSKVISGLKEDVKYYFRLRNYKTIKGKNYFSVWSAKKCVRIARCTVPPSVNAVSASAGGTYMGVISVKGNSARLVRSKDDYYYLFEVNAYTNELVQMIDSRPKAKSFQCDLHKDQNAAYPIMKYAWAVRTGSGTGLSDYTRVSPAVYVSDPEYSAEYLAAYYYPATKKGLQSADFYELKDSNSKTCFFNIFVSDVTNGAYVPFTYNGRTYYFNDLEGMRSLVSRCNRDGIQVTVQVMLDEAGPDLMKAATGGEFLYGFNVADRDARMWMDAMFLYLSRTFGTDDCYVSNWILGNEVNSCSFYWYTGHSTEDEFISNYTDCFRDFYNSVRSVRASSRVFISLEHCWTMANSGSLSFPGKSVLEKFNAALEKIQPGAHWDLAYHPYPANLLVPSFWNDNLPNNANAGVISPKNLRAFTNYIKKEYGKDTRIILSEIGFNIWGSDENTQAAAVALSYFIAACDPMIDGYMLRSYRDEPGDAMYGVAMGLYGRRGLDVFRYMDTPRYLDYAWEVLYVNVGPQWENYVPDYDPNAICGMYRY